MKKITIDFASVQNSEGKQDTSHFVTEGSYQLKKGSSYFLFQENHEGMEPVKTTIKVSSNMITVIRNGPLKMHHTYIKGELTSSFYTSPLGRWELETKTYSVEWKWDEEKDKGRLFVAYELFLQGNYVGRHSFELKGKVNTLH